MSTFSRSAHLLPFIFVTICTVEAQASKGFIKDTWVDALGDYTRTRDQGRIGVTDAGDTVTWNGASGAVRGLTFGVNAFVTVQEGIDAVDARGTVFIAAGEYQKGSVITVEKSLTLKGDGADLTVLSRDDSKGDESANQHPILGIMGARTKVTIDGMTISGGRTATPDSGGGITCNDGTVIVSNCTVSSNTSMRFRSGGGIGGRLPRITVMNSTVSGNTSKGLRSGGGIGGHLPTITVINSTVSDNMSRTGFSGGGIGGWSSIITVTNSTVSGNISGGYQSGGGIGGLLPTITMTNSTVSGNIASSDGDGGISGNFHFGGSVSLSNTLVVGNFHFGGSASELGGIDFPKITGGGGNLIAIPDGLTINDILDPVLRDHGGVTWTHALVPGSPALNAGVNDNLTGDFDNDANTPDTTLTTDQRGPGFDRIFNATVDIGAFELPQRKRP